MSRPYLPIERMYAIDCYRVGLTKVPRSKYSDFSRRCATPSLFEWKEYVLK